MWRYRLPIVQLFLAPALLFLDSHQQNRYYQELEILHPQWEPDYGYNPSARLVAALLCGPGIVVPNGTWPYAPSAHIRQALSLLLMSASWFWLGWLLDRRLRGQGPVIRNPLMRAVAYFLLLIVLGLLGWKLIHDVQRFSIDPMFALYLKRYGAHAIVHLDFAAALWLVVAFGLGLRTFVASLRLPGRRTLLT